MEPVGALLLRAREVANTTALGLSTVYLMMASGELPTVRMGRAVRVPAAALREWIGNRSRGGDRV
jgi:excisionase family DNA binding protein